MVSRLRTSRVSAGIMASMSTQHAFEWRGNLIDPCEDAYGTFGPYKSQMHVFERRTLVNELAGL